MRILITGASGFVGARVVLHLKNENLLFTPSHGEMNITDMDSVDNYISANKPEAILHLAALSNTGYCEENPTESYEVNVKGTVNLAQIADRYGVKFVFFSSDQVYNGCTGTGLLNEERELSPENIYGLHKLQAEKEALRVSPSTVALRATWMYDNNRDGMKPHANFVLNMAKAITNGEKLRFPTREYRGITWVQQVVEMLPFTFDLPGGVYNYGAENLKNTYETAVDYIELLNYTKPIKEIIIADEQRFPQHIRNISISIQKIRNASSGKINFLPTHEGFKLYLGESFSIS